MAAMAPGRMSPVAAVLLGRSNTTALAIVLAALVFSRHGDNIRRLRAVPEPRIGQKI